MNISKILALVGLLCVGAACAPSASTHGGCGNQGFFQDQASCLSAASWGCEMTSIQLSSESKSLICWKPSLKAPNPTPTPRVQDGLSQGDPSLEVRMPDFMADLYKQVHSSDNCKALNGSVRVAGAGNKICMMAGSACPVGWRTYYTGSVRWTITAQTQDTQKTDCGADSRTVSTPFHLGLAPVEVEKLTFCPLTCMGKCQLKEKTIYAKILHIACY